MGILDPAARVEAEILAAATESGYDDARAEFLVKFAKMIDRGDDPETIRAWISDRCAKADAAGRWPDGWPKV